MCSPSFLWPSSSYPGSTIPVVLFEIDVNSKCSLWQWGACIHFSISSFFHQLWTEHILGARHWVLVEGKATQSLPHGACSASEETGTCRVPAAAIFSQDHDSFFPPVQPTTVFAHLVSATNLFHTNQDNARHLPFYIYAGLFILYLNTSAVSTSSCWL